MGADDYITKPFTRQEILQAIQTRFHKAELLQSHVIRQYSDLRSRMNQIIPHELLSPLSVITGLSGLLLQRDAEITEDQVQTIARDIQKSGEKLSYLLQQYIEYSELEGMWQEPEKIQQFRQSRLQDAGRRTEEIVSKIAELYHREKDLSLACENVSIAITGFHFEKVIEDVAELIFHYSPPGSDVKVMVHLCQNTHMACIEFMSRSLGFFDRDIVDDSGHSTMNISILIVKFLVEMYNGRMESIKEETGYLKTCLYFPPAN